MPKSSPKKKKSGKESSFKELIKGNNFLHQYCNFINFENGKNTLEIQKLIIYTSFLENKIKELGKILEFLTMHMDPKIIEKMRNQLKEEIENTNKKTDVKDIKQETKKIIFHDNITTKCPNCKSIGTINDVNCKECGFKI